MRRLASIAVLTCLGSPLSGGEFFVLEGHGGPIKGIDVETGTGAVLTASFDNSVGYWAARDGTPIWLERHDAAANTVRFLGDGLAVSGGDDYAVYLWDLQTSTPKLLGKHEGKVISLAVSPDRSRVASASWDGTAAIWPLDGGDPIMIRGHKSGVGDVKFSTDGQQLYSASADGSIRLWDAMTGLPDRVLLQGGFGINTLVVNEPAGWIAYGAVDGVTRVIDIETGDLVKDFTLDRRPILAMASDPSFDYLAIGDGEGYISVLETRDWDLIADFRATTRGPIWALAFSPDGENVHAGGLDDKMFSWPLDGAQNQQMETADRSFLRGNEGDSNGERQFNRKCSICHALTADGQRRAGPTLKDVFGRQAGTLSGYNYSETLRNSDIIWNEETIDTLFDLGPEVYIHGTKMPMQRIAREADRSDLIAFLRGFSTIEE